MTVHSRTDSDGNTYQVWAQRQAMSCAIASMWMARNRVMQMTYAEGEWALAQRAFQHAVQGIPWAAAYAASKGAVLAMTRAIAVEYADQGLRANCVCPADIKTPMTSPVFPEGADLRKLGRIRSLSGVRGPEAVASVIAMLASDDAAHITGEYIRIDGGALA